MVLYDTAPDLALLTLPLWILAALGVALGVGLWLGALNALYRDVRYTLAFILQIWLFASPVVFPSSLITGPERWLFALNPMVGVIDGLRWASSTGRLRRLRTSSRSPPGSRCLSAASSTSSARAGRSRTGSDGGPRGDRGP